MRKVVLLVVLLLMCATASQAYLELVSGGGSMGWYREITTTPGATYSIDAVWQGDGTRNWCEVLLFNDDGSAIYGQIDAPADASVISKVDDWSMNGGMPFGWAPITDYLYPNGSGSNVVTATGSKMYLALKNGTSDGASVCRFDEIYLNKAMGTDNLAASEDGWVRWGSPWWELHPWGDPNTFEYNVVVPEPASVMALLTGLLGLGGCVLRRRK